MVSKCNYDYKRALLLHQFFSISMDSCTIHRYYVGDFWKEEIVCITILLTNERKVIRFNFSMINVQKKLYTGMNSVKRFVLKSIRFDTKNFESLLETQSEDDYKRYEFGTYTCIFL